MESGRRLARALIAQADARHPGGRGGRRRAGRDLGRRAGGGDPACLAASSGRRRKIIPALEFQHRESDCCPRSEAAPPRAGPPALQGRLLSDGSARRQRPEEAAGGAMRLLEQSAVRVKGHGHRAARAPERRAPSDRPGERRVARGSSPSAARATALCLFSELGPVVRALPRARGRVTSRERPAGGLRRVALLDGRIRREIFPPPRRRPRRRRRVAPIIDRIAEDIRLSPRVLSHGVRPRVDSPATSWAGWAGFLRPAGGLAERIGLTAPFKVMNPFQAVEMKTSAFRLRGEPFGPQFLHAFGLALRGPMIDSLQHQPAPHRGGRPDVAGVVHRDPPGKRQAWCCFGAGRRGACCC